MHFKISLLFSFVKTLAEIWWVSQPLNESQFVIIHPFLTCFPVQCELCQWCWWTGGSMGLQCKMLKLTLSLSCSAFLPLSISFCPLLLLPPSPLSPSPSPSLCSSGYSLLHVTGEDTWKRIQLQIWHLVARMPALRGKLWEYVHTLSPCSRL